MKTSVIEVHDMLSVLSVADVEKRIGEVAGVESVTVNFAAGSATVRYDETRLALADIKSDVRQNANKSDKSAAPAATSAGSGHEGHTPPGAPPANPVPPAPKTTPGAPANAGTASEGAAQPTKAAPSTTPKPSPTAPAIAPEGEGHQHKAVPDKS